MLTRRLLFIVIQGLHLMLRSVSTCLIVVYISVVNVWRFVFCSYPCIVCSSLFCLLAISFLCCLLMFVCFWLSCCFVTSYYLLYCFLTMLAIVLMCCFLLCVCVCWLMFKLRLFYIILCVVLFSDDAGDCFVVLISFFCVCVGLF